VASTKMAEGPRRAKADAARSPEDENPVVSKKSRREGLHQTGHSIKPSAYGAVIRNADQLNFTNSALGEPFTAPAPVVGAGCASTAR
jgi:hypothetical protein